jgi:hypothetical protein
MVTKRNLLAMFAVAMSWLVAGCAGNGAHGAPVGTALKIEQSSVGVALDIPASYVRIGRTYGFAFPALHNVSGRTLTLERVTLVHVPTGVGVLKYKLLSIKETPGYLLDSSPGSGDSSDYAKYPNYPLSKRVVVKAHSLSDYYPIFYVRAVGPLPIAQHMSGCRYMYAQSGKRYEQILPCDYSLSGP